MTQGKDAGTEPKVPSERPDRQAAERPAGGTDRPGFDLGGAEGSAARSGTDPAIEPRGNPEIGNEQPTDRSRMTSRKGTPA
ncbi:hypothetical protein [Methylobacterium oxalidis]|uniref:Uncharacterized protein n=1 Tax=Methylobacterium oxalidis TaxID=944322 RepID=A0A512J2W2_9HYPH|nr:hypothetical protein [Methylobacterium oxalidis]GEP04281.1 hypothetical protein MOX02_23190 [Methylobacterium oxalidis]GJE33004.1 hypothetical protein LDDCCGHA_3203 [Methylobacterium oxalidis]GLS67200.1 hypothetical protein GCM10007888_55830 [Methylobacterium oxalidis]